MLADLQDRRVPRTDAAGLGHVVHVQELFREVLPQSGSLVALLEFVGAGVVEVVVVHPHRHVHVHAQFVPARDHMARTRSRRGAWRRPIRDAATCGSAETWSAQRGSGRRGRPRRDTTCSWRALGEWSDETERYREGGLLSRLVSLIGVLTSAGRGGLPGRLPVWFRAVRTGRPTPPSSSRRRMPNEDGAAATACRCPAARALIVRLWDPSRVFDTGQQAAGDELAQNQSKKKRAQLHEQPCPAVA